MTTPQRKRQSAATEPAAEMSDAPANEKISLGKLEGHLGYFVRRLQITIFKDFIKTLAPMKLRPAQYSVLLVIEANPGRSQAAIAQALNIERARLVRMLHELEKRKWIARRAANGDGRSHSLYLTPEGEKAMARIKALTGEHEAEMAKLVGPRRRLLLIEMLKEFG